eukprot:267742-Hanusia_phi.AAC.1
MNPDEEAGAPVDPRRPDMRRIYAERGGGRAGAITHGSRRSHGTAGPDRVRVTVLTDAQQTGF